MRIGGFQEFTLIDYPGKVAAVVFTQGCNFRCPYCHNCELALPERFQDLIPEEEIFSFLRQRVGKLEGLVITGGEPTLQNDLAAFIQQVKSLGYLVKLDTNGSRPDVIENLIQRRLIDFIAMDIKASLERYDKVTGVKVDREAILKSVQLIRNSNVDYEFRTTLVLPLHKNIEGELTKIHSLMEGSRRYRLQKFTPSEKVMDQALCRQRHLTEAQLEDLRRRWEIPTVKTDVGGYVLP